MIQLCNSSSVTAPAGFGGVCLFVFDWLVFLVFSFVGFFLLLFNQTL